jgi:very-short-patch-repair endonuclease
MSDHRFRKQAPIGVFVVDFACLAAKLVIEVGVGQHADSKASDDERTAWLEKRGYRVLRFWNSDVLSNIDGVLQEIAKALSAPSPEIGGG